MKRIKAWLLALSLIVGLSAGHMALAAKEFDVDGVTKSIENNPGFVNDTDPRSVYTGPWSKNQFTPAGGVASNGGRDWTSLYAGGGRAYLGEIKGATVEFTFVGTSIMVLMTRYTDLGSVEFVLDNQAPVRADLHCESSEADDNYAAFKKTGLSSGTHTIKMTSVEMPEREGKKSLGYIHLIGFVTDNGVINSTNTTYATPKGFTVNSDAQPNQMATCCVGDDLLVSSKSGSTVTFQFEGSYVGILSKVGKGYGTASVSIDGAAAGDISLDASKTAIQKMVFAKGGLSEGKHTLTLTTKSAATFTVDAFIVKQSASAVTTTVPSKATMKTTAGHTPQPTTSQKTTGKGGSNATGTPADPPTDSPSSSSPTDVSESAATSGTNGNTVTASAPSTLPAGGEPAGGNRTAVVVVVTIMIVLLLGIGGAATYLLYIKPKMAAKHKGE